MPWREGTEVRSARREDVIRLVAPLKAVPIVELQEGHIRVSPADGYDEGTFYASFTIYIVPPDEAQIVAPDHKFSATFCINGDPIPYVVKYVQFHPSGNSTTLHASHSELVINGPGRCTVDLSFSDERRPQLPLESAEAEITIGFAGVERVISVSCQFAQFETEKLRLSSHQVIVQRKAQ